MNNRFKTKTVSYANNRITKIYPVDQDVTLYEVLEFAGFPRVVFARVDEENLRVDPFLFEKDFSIENLPINILNAKVGTLTLFHDESFDAYSGAKSWSRLYVRIVSQGGAKFYAKR